MAILGSLGTRGLFGGSGIQEWLSKNFKEWVKGGYVSVPASNTPYPDPRPESGGIQELWWYTRDLLVILVDCTPTNC